MTDSIRLGDVEIELKTKGKAFLGLGRITIGSTVVRSGELPICPFTETLYGLIYDNYEIQDIKATTRRVVISTRAFATAGHVAVVQDHSLDPVGSTRPWDGRTFATDRMDWIIERADRTFGDRAFTGFKYSFRFRSRKREIHYLLDRATWELDGKAEGITLLRQQMGDDPRATIRARTDYSTSALIDFDLNPIMTHDVPRWASEQGFDYQYRDGQALVGVFDAVGLVRTIVAREPRERVIRHFDKHIFDISSNVTTVPKFIGLARSVGDDSDHLNMWTRVFDADQDNVLDEFGMRRPTILTTLAHNYWQNYTSETYYQDMLPAAAALACQRMYIDSMWENDMTRVYEGALPDYLTPNMCCPHEYEVGRKVGGVAGFRKLTQEAAKQGVEVASWLGSHQSIRSRYYHSHGGQALRIADGRHVYGSGYEDIKGMDLTTEFGRMFREAVLRACKETGVKGFLYDSFYNFGWMPVNFCTATRGRKGQPARAELRPHTQWRALCKIMAAWQRAGLHMTIESLGPWGQPQHGMQDRYDKPGCEPLAYQCSGHIGHRVIPGPAEKRPSRYRRAYCERYYRFIANKAPLMVPLWNEASDGTRTRSDLSDDASAIKAANLVYRRVLPLMHTRTLLPEGTGVLWHAEKGRRQVVFCLKRTILPLGRRARYLDLTTGKSGPCDSEGLRIERNHTYIIQ